MRVLLNNDHDADLFSSDLLNIGDGQKTTDFLEWINFLRQFVKIVAFSELLCIDIFTFIAENYSTSEWLCTRAMIAPKNDTVNVINSAWLTRIPGKAIFYQSIDTVLEENQMTQYSVEFLNTLELPGVSPHKPNFKYSIPATLMRNLEAPRLCTRLIV